MAAGHIRNAKPNKIQKKRTAAALLVLGLLSVLILLSWTHFHPSSSDNSSPIFQPIPPLCLSTGIGTMPASLHPQHSPRTVPFMPTRLFRRRRQRQRTPGRFAPGPRRCQALLGLPDKVRPHRSLGAHAARLCFLSPGGSHLLDTQESNLKPAKRFSPTASTLRVRVAGIASPKLPAVPTSPSEPGKEVLDHPVAPLIPETTDSPLPGPIWSDGSTPLLPGPGAPGGTDPGLLPFFPFPCCGSSPGRSPSPSPGPLTPPDPPPVVATPEPASLVLFDRWRPQSFFSSGNSGRWPGHETPGQFWVPHPRFLRVGSWFAGVPEALAV